jgi:hypothetical protein
VPGRFVDFGSSVSAKLLKDNFLHARLGFMRTNLQKFSALMLILSVSGTVFAQRRRTETASRSTFENPHQLSVGVKDVFVNGTQVLKDGEHTGAKPGRALWGPGKTM